VWQRFSCRKVKAAHTCSLQSHGSRFYIFPNIGVFTFLRKQRRKSMYNLVSSICKSNATLNYFGFQWMDVITFNGWASSLWTILVLYSLCFKSRLSTVLSKLYQRMDVITLSLENIENLIKKRGYFYLKSSLMEHYL